VKGAIQKSGRDAATSKGAIQGRGSLRGTDGPEGRGREVRRRLPSYPDSTGQESYEIYTEVERVLTKRGEKEFFSEWSLIDKKKKKKKRQLTRIDASKWKEKDSKGSGPNKGKAQLTT